MRTAVCFLVFNLFASGLNIAKAGASPPTPITSGGFIEYSPIYTKEIESFLDEAISSRLGLPYRWGGTDDNGYDCSGFVWRVFREAGVDFDRDSTRHLWQKLPEASQEESQRFGTLVFFQGLDHAGIVRDAASLYHAATSGGVMLSNVDKSDKQWRGGIVGYGRTLAPGRRRAGPGRK